MSRTDIPDLNSPEFAGIRTQLTRAFIEHKADLGVPQASDQDILEHVDDIMALLVGTATKALELRSAEWFRRYGWFIDLIVDLIEGRGGNHLIVDACERLFSDQAAVPFDG
jgi:hypothetical protein